MDRQIEITKEEELNFWKAYFGSILPLGKQDYIYREDIRNSLKDKNIAGNTLFICNLPLYKYTLVEAIKNTYKDSNRLPKYTLISGYSLCEVWVKDLEVGEIRTLTDTYRPDILLILIENIKSRVSNKEYFNIIKQVITERTLRGKGTWLYYNGNESDLMNDSLDMTFDAVIPIKLKAKTIKEESVDASTTKYIY